MGLSSVLQKENLHILGKDGKFSKKRKERDVEFSPANTSLEVEENETGELSMFSSGFCNNSQHILNFDIIGKLVVPQYVFGLIE